MPGIRLAALVRQLRRDAAPDSGGCPDADLLARFATTRDEAAFELLVWRHGAMVLAACRRVLGHTEDAEDAFQAAFLVLSRKAASVRRGTAVPAWLHRVAVRIARRAAGKRKPTTSLLAEPVAPASPDAAERDELRGLLDAEIDRLSDPLRRAFVLCYLEGLSNAEAARLLGCPVGTVESRLTAARRRLRDRLARGRVAVQAGVLALLACHPGLAAGAVATVTRAGVTAAARGLSAATGIVREPAVRLAEGVLAVTKTRYWVAVVLGVSLVGLAAGVGWASLPGDVPARPEPVAEAPEETPQPTPGGETAKPGEWPLATQVRGCSGLLTGVSPDGKSIILLENKGVYWLPVAGKSARSSVQSENPISAVAVSPDGKYVATAEGANGVKLRDAATGNVVEALWPAGELPATQVAFSPDSTKLIALCTRSDFPVRKKGEGPLGLGQPKGVPFSREGKTTQLTRVSVWDVPTRKELGHPVATDTANISSLPYYTLAGNGRYVLKTEAVYEADADGRETLKGRRFTVTDAVSGVAAKPVEVLGEKLGQVRSSPLSPDGKTLVLLDPEKNELRFLDTTTGKDRFGVPAFRRPVRAVVFSPDGKLVAAATGLSGAGRPDTIAAPSEVVVWDAATGKELARLTDKESIRDYQALAFSPNGSFLVAQTGTDLHSLTIWGHLPPRDPEPVKPAAKAAGVADAPPRFQALIRDLAGEGVTDARRVESVFLAALGRFPTDVEARTLAAQLAKRDDKSAALRDLLGTLVETAEFKAHAEELGRLSK